jgi:nucleoside 2-deoxyribosyltransferase
MERADAFILVLPCGRSAHLEAGWAIGQGKPTAILLDPDHEHQVTPELMYKMADLVTYNSMELLTWLGVED